MAERRFTVHAVTGAGWTVVDGRRGAVAEAHGMRLSRLTPDDAIDWACLLNFRESWSTRARWPIPAVKAMSRGRKAGD